MRKIPKDAPPVPPTAADMTRKKIRVDAKEVEVTLITQERKYELITPLFGGGVEPNKNDDLTPISGKSIRGHLRFWWRATRGGRFNGDLQKMKEAEAAIWGAASTVNKSNVSQVQISVTLLSTDAEHEDQTPFTVEDVRKDGQLRRNQTIQHTDVAPPYAAFPLQPPERGRRTGMSAATIRKNISFELSVSYPESMRTDVCAALWAWEIFGGIGARIRRGFGALAWVDKDNNFTQRIDNLQSVTDEILNGIGTHVCTGKLPDGVPHLPTSADRFVVIKPTHTNAPANHVWNKLIENLKSFRQMRSGGGGRGRSQWTEPDEIRARSSQTLARHKTPVYDGDDIYLFPRAAFGLPINFPFHYQQSNPASSRDSNLDPAKTKLTLETSDRWASPLILRPLKCKDSFFGVALILDSTMPTDLRLYYEDDGSEVSTHAIDVVPTTDEAKIIRPLNGEKDILKAFLNYLRRNNSR